MIYDDRLAWGIGFDRINRHKHDSWVTIKSRGYYL